MPKSFHNLRFKFNPNILPVVFDLSGHTKDSGTRSGLRHLPFATPNELNHKKRMLLRFLHALVATGLIFLAQSGREAFAFDQTGRMPHNWDSGERLHKGDLTGLQRLRFLTTLDFPPFNYMASDGKLSGLNIEIARAICKELNVSGVCQIQALPWDELQPALKSGQGEAIIAGLGADADTRRSLAFTRPYMLPVARFAKRKDHAGILESEGGLAKVSIGVVAGSMHERMLRAYFPEATIASLPGMDALFRELASAKVDAIFGDGLTFSRWLAGGAGACCEFSGEPYFSTKLLGGGMRIAVKAEDVELERSLNFALNSLHEKGMMDELYLKYFPVGFY